MKKVISTLGFLFLIYSTFAQGFTTEDIEKVASKYKGTIELRNGQQINFSSLWIQGAGLRGGGMDNFFSVPFSYDENFSPSPSVARIFKFSNIKRVEFFKKVEVQPTEKYASKYTVYMAKVHLIDNTVKDSIFVRIDVWHYKTNFEQGEIYATDNLIKSVSFLHNK
jgi:hypothetical protein